MRDYFRNAIGYITILSSVSFMGCSMSNHEPHRSQQQIASSRPTSKPAAHQFGPNSYELSIVVNPEIADKVKEFGLDAFATDLTSHVDEVIGDLYLDRETLKGVIELRNIYLKDKMELIKNKKARNNKKANNSFALRD